MPPTQFDPDVLAACFGGLSGFRFITSGSYKSVYGVAYANGSAAEVLKVVCLPVARATEEDEALFQQELGRVQRETDILKACTSPFVVKLGNVAPQLIDINGHSCFAYSEELLSGSDLRTVIELSSGALPTEAEVKCLLSCLVNAVQTLWRDHRVVHRDIKPANIFSTRDARRPYVLIDLGIAYDVSVPGLTLRKLDLPHTPLYMSPEMLTADFRETLSYRSDLYSAGLSAFEFAAGTHPLAKIGDDSRRTYTRVMHQEPIPLEQLRADLSPPLCALVNQLLKKTPALRPANFGMILQQLE